MSVRRNRAIIGWVCALVLIVLAGAAWRPSAKAAQTKMGTVYGVVKTQEGKPVGGFWLMIANPDLGMNYRKDVNPIGQFRFTDVYPGKYTFKISPYSYTVVSPPQIEVKGGDAVEVEVIVARAPR